MVSCLQVAEVLFFIVSRTTVCPPIAFLMFKVRDVCATNYSSISHLCLLNEVQSSYRILFVSNHLSAACSCCKINTTHTYCGNDVFGSKIV